MIGRRVRAAALSGLTLTGLAVASAAAASPGLATPPTCSSGAHTLSHFGDHVYPETGNGGYTSLHTDVHMIYDAPSNQFLPGNHVVLTVRATQCLTDFSLDFDLRAQASIARSALSTEVCARPRVALVIDP